MKSFIDSKFNTIVKISPLILLSIFILWANMDYASYEKLATQERVIEIFQAFFYFSAAFLVLYIVTKIRGFENNWVLGFLTLIALGFLFIGMEEISWGQRILNFETPETIKQVNVQGELTLHNIDIFQKTFILHSFFIIFGLFFAFSNKILKELENFSSKLSGISKYSLNENLVLFFLLPSIFYFFIEFFSNLFIQKFGIKIFVSSDQEIFEFILSLGVMLYSIFLLKFVRFTENPNSGSQEKFMANN